MFVSGLLAAERVRRGDLPIAKRFQHPPAGSLTLPVEALRVETLSQGRPRPVNDNWVAACCLARELPLATLNIKGFSDFAEHEGLELTQITVSLVECHVARNIGHHGQQQQLHARRRPW